MTDGLGLVIKRAEQLRLPAVPHARPDRANVGGGEDEEHLQALQILHHGGEILDGLAIREIARLRDHRHHEVLFHEPRHGFRFGWR